MPGGEFDVVTGAFGYTGKYIARRLLAMGRRVRTLTGHPNRPHPFGGQVEVAPLAFEDPSRLAESLRGAATLYNTYWIRFAQGGLTFERAVENTRCLLRAAEQAGVRRIVHLSITNASETSPLPYFRGKGEMERSIMESQLSYAILRPTVIFGPEDILINNIAWCLRRFPVFVIPGRGDYRIQPVFVEDLAEMAVALAQRDTNASQDAVGPEVFRFDELVRLIAAAVGSRAKIIHLPARVAYAVAGIIGVLVRDMVLTWDEVGGLMADLLVSARAPTGTTRLSNWLAANVPRVGASYASELARHYR